ncbi:MULTISPECIES: hypothetical protein [Virgibacillus]|uniref:Uncharacterized protein n=2 Tax=Virgibacillus TaxID=84406 RepID=A0A024Q734_9BACI|nr:MULTISPECIES: hypothetical protein [Virgibacillus]EQB38393.1 hypothetical protein M948_07375 [Virgibacillus sp. CM-4]MYL41099.1 hypothetical protein [Virgibacillus massiliensis]GGJ54270.1 hypothetical protein GCM10007111_15610 [Virgibacillus kapii]CDQ38097.1 hypothetical protein BN990_00364 [Virgibacillus massiliensis]
MEETLSITEEEIKRYYVLHEQKKEMEQELNQLKKKFHHYLDNTTGKDRKGDIQRGNYQVLRQIRSAIKYTPEQTVQKLEELQLSDFVITEKRPDTEKLDAAIKLGLVDEAAFEDCKNTKVTQAIVVKEGK